MDKHAVHYEQELYSSCAKLLYGYIWTCVHVALKYIYMYVYMYTQHGQNVGSFIVQCVSPNNQLVQRACSCEVEQDGIQRRCLGRTGLSRQ